jgi:hypothetical protein
LWSANHVAIAIVAALLFSGAMAVARTGIVTVGQRVTAPEFMGRSIATGDAIARLVSSLTASLAAILLNVWSPTLVIVLGAFGVGLGVIVAATFLGPLRGGNLT